MPPLNIFEVAKLAKGVERDQREELLLTGLLGWTFENSTSLLQRVLSRARPLDLNDSREGPPLPPNGDYEVTRERGAMSDQGERVRFDLRIEWDNFLAVIETKVVRLDSPDGLTVGQLQKYHLSVPGEKRGMYGVVALTPDTMDALRGGLSSLETGRRNTFLLVWDDVYGALEETDSDASDPVDRFLARELGQAIELVPNLKPFRGFEDDEIAALRQIPKAAEVVQQLFRSVRGHLTARGLEYDAGKGGKFYPNGPWDVFYDPGFRLPSGEGECSDIYYGPWIQPEKGCYSIYLETEASTKAREALSNLLGQTGFTEDLERRLSGRFLGRLPKLGLSERTGTRLVVDVPFENDLFTSRASELPGLTAEVVQFLRDEVASRLARV